MAPVTVQTTARPGQSQPVAGGYFFDSSADGHSLGWGDEHTFWDTILRAGKFQFEM